MFIRSASMDTKQGQAIHACNIAWGGDNDDGGGDRTTFHGRESIGIPVCKKKYKPFRFRRRDDGTIAVERMFACACHDELRKATALQHGLRPGWTDFGQWSRQKATELARKVAAREAAAASASPTPSASSSSSDSENGSSSDSEVEDAIVVVSSKGSSAAAAAAGGSGYCPELAQLCHNGQCAWKVRNKYDDVAEEIEEMRAERRRLQLQQQQAVPNAENK